MVEAMIQYRVRFTGGAVHPGAGMGSARAARCILRERNEQPLIPGSHVRGVTRHRMEQLERLLDQVTDYRFDDSTIESSWTGKPVRGPVARVFDGGGGALTVFEDLRPASGPPAQVDVRARVSIDCRRGTPRPRRLFDTDVWTEDSFEGSVAITLEDEATARLDLALLVAALRLVDALGGGRSTGLGRCRIDIARVEMNGRDVPLEEVLRDLEEQGMEA